MRVANCGHIEGNPGWARGGTIFDKACPCFFCLDNGLVLAPRHGRGNLVRKEWRDMADAGF